MADCELRDKEMPFSHKRTLAQITMQIEPEPFRDGYALAPALGNGSCKRLFYPGIEFCALILGQSCPPLFKTRSPEEAIGMVVYIMGVRVA
jgi:predicted metal-binding protein